MAFTTNLARYLTKNAREQGKNYYYGNKVTIHDADNWWVDATVRGSQEYSVSIEREDNALIVTCSCPYFLGSVGICKHIWATCLEAEEAGALLGDRGRAPTELIPDLDFIFDAPVDDSFDDVDMAEERNESRSANGAGTNSPRRKPASSAPPDIATPWRKTLSALRTRMEGASTSSSNTSLAPGDEVIYVVDVAKTIEGGGLALELTARTRKLDGEWSKPVSRRFDRTQVPKLSSAADREIIATLVGARERDNYNSRYSYGYGYEAGVSKVLLDEALVAALLPKICGTERCLLRPRGDKPELIPLRWDGPEPWEFWLKLEEITERKEIALRGELRRGDERMPLEKPHVLIGGGHVFWDDKVAPLHDFDAFSWISTLRESGTIPVPAKHREQLLAEVLALPRLPRLDLPEELRFEEVQLAPQPCATIKPRDRGYYGAGVDKNWFTVDVSFDYDGIEVPSTQSRTRIYNADRRRMMIRDEAAEQSALARLPELGVHFSNNYGRQETRELNLRNFARAVRTLVQEGWRVEAEGKLYKQSGGFKIEVSSGIDWFELQGGMSFGDEFVALPKLLAALRRGENFVSLGDGTFGMLPEEWLKKFGLLAHVGAAEGDRVQFKRTQVALVDALLADQPEVHFDQRFKRARDKLLRFERVEPADAPREFRGALREYQRDGLGWLHFLREFGFGGCLADDMGLGKTVQVLALLEARRQKRARSKKDSKAGASLVVVPRSLVFNWKHEAAHFTPRLRILDYTESQRGKPGEHFNDFDLILSTYGTLRRDIADLKEYCFDYAILDEAQAIKNASSQSAKAARLINADHRLSLSGTPVENHLGELWSQMEFLNPGMFGKAAALGLTDGALRNPPEETRVLLSRALRPFILRRTKDQVANDLPAKTEQTIYCDLEPQQRKLYDELRQHYRESLLGRIEREGIKKAKIQILEALLRLRQAACHPGLIDKTKRFTDSSAKLDALVPQLREVFDEGHKTLVFSQFTSLLEIVKHRLNEDGITYEYLDGRTRDRQARVDRFQTDPKCKLFLISLKAGGLGLNLTAADYVFLLDPWWNPAVESQAIDRAHRIGQVRPVFAYRLIARDTVEEKVLQLQEQKRALADAIITADNSVIGSLGREDLELLLS